MTDHTPTTTPPPLRQDHFDVLHRLIEAGSSGLDGQDEGLCFALAEVGCSEDDEDLSELAPGEDQPAALTPPRAVEGELPALPARPIPALPPRQVLALPPREGTKLTMFAGERS